MCSAVLHCGTSYMNHVRYVTLRNKVHVFMCLSMLSLSSDCGLPCLHFSWFCCSCLFAALDAESMCPHSLLILSSTGPLGWAVSWQFKNPQLVLEEYVRIWSRELWDDQSCFHFVLKDEHLLYMLRMSSEVPQWLGMSPVINESMDCTCDIVDVCHSWP